MKRRDCEVAIIGAGVAGLAAAAVLARAGRDVRCLEATGRVGGRILTLHDSLAPLPIELGAEFVHGRPPEIWELIRGTDLRVFEHTSRALHVDRGRILKDAEVGESADAMLAQMAKSGGKKDSSFEDYLRRSRQPAGTKNWARIYVEGFNAARSSLISVGSLIKESSAADKIDGDRTFRILDGYDSIAISLMHSIPEHQEVVHLNSVVEHVSWSRGQVEVEYRSGLDRQKSVLRCEKLIITVPLGVLQATAPSPGAIRFDPEPRANLEAARLLRFGEAHRVTFRFPRAFWEEDENFNRVGFIVSQDKQFFTWWTTHPILSPLLTAWTGGSATDQFRTSEPLQIMEAALASLSRILKRKLPAPEAAYFHNWSADPYFRGAYSYVPVNAVGARETLAKPNAGALFFAGEATDLDGHGGTVHGAIAAGRRVAELVQDMTAP